jgi:hypothetical protein
MTRRNVKTKKGDEFLVSQALNFYDRIEGNNLQLK